MTQGYTSSLKDEQNGNATVTLTNEWTRGAVGPGLDQVVVWVDDTIGNEAQMRLGWSDGRFGPPLFLKLGLNVRSDLARYNFDRYELRNATNGANAAVTHDSMAVS